MAFFKKIKKRLSGLWYPQSVTVGKPVTTDMVAERLSQMSTVSRADTYAVLKDLGFVMGDYMAQGRTVKLEGMGTFFYSAIASGNGVATEEEVSAKQIKSVRVRFIPETKRTANNQVATRSMVSNNIFWEEWGGSTKGTTPTEDDKEPGGDGNTGWTDPTG